MQLSFSSRLENLSRRNAKFRSLLIIKFLKKFTRNSKFNIFDSLTKQSPKSGAKNKLQRMLDINTCSKKVSDDDNQFKKYIEIQIDQMLKKNQYINSKHLKIIEENIRDYAIKNRISIPNPYCSNQSRDKNNGLVAFVIFRYSEGP